MPDKPSTFSETLRRLGPAGYLAAAAAVLPPVGMLILFGTIAKAAPWLREQGAAGVALYIAGFAVFAGLAMLPTWSTAALGGWAFGVQEGIGAALAGFLLGALVGYGVARPTAAARVEPLIAEHPKWKAVRDALVGGGFWKTLAIITLLRLPPNSPFAITNLVLASVRARLGAYALGTLVGMAPRTAIAVYIGSTLRDRLASEMKDAPKPWWAIAGGIAAMVVVMGVIGVIANRAVHRMAGGSGEKR